MACFALQSQFCVCLEGELSAPASSCEGSRTGAGKQGISGCCTTFVIDDRSGPFQPKAFDGSMVTGGCGQGRIRGTASLLRSRCCSPAPSPLWVPPTAGMGLSARLWGCCTAAGCVNDGMLLPFPVSLGAACMAEVQAVPVGAGWHQPSPRARGGSWALNTEGWSHVLLFLGNSPGAVAVTTLTRTFGGYFGCPEVPCPIWESLVQQ